MRLSSTHLSRLFKLAAGLLFFASSSLAQPAETCGPGDSLGGLDTLPQNLVGSALSDDFTMTGAGCNERQFDHVTCLTPTTDCTIVAACAAGVRLSSDTESNSEVDSEGLQVSVNAVEGACSTAPASCLASSVGTGASGDVNVAVTGGTTYCFVCEVDFAKSLQLSLSTAGDCGFLPVGLQSFSIDEE